MHCMNEYVCVYMYSKIYNNNKKNMNVCVYILLNKT